MPYTPQVGEMICAGLEDGKSLLQVCRELDLNESTVRKWARTDPEFGTNYERARELGDDAKFDRLAEIYREEPLMTASGFVDSGWVKWKKDQIDTVKWQLARSRPKKYGDRQQHTGVDDGPIQFVLTRVGEQ